MQEVVTGSAPKPIQLYHQGYMGSDPKNPNACVVWWPKIDW
jgi:hypothetical protein